MAQVTTADAPSEDLAPNPPWPRGAVAPALTNEKRGFTVSAADFSRQVKDWAFFRKFGIGFASALFLCGQGAMAASELLRA
jgi:hypothetical protein